MSSNSRADGVEPTYPSADCGNAYDALMYDVCVVHGYCGSIVDGKHAHVDHFIPEQGLVTADQFVDWVLDADGATGTPLAKKHRSTLRAMFVHRMGGEVVDASRLTWSSTIDNAWPVLDWGWWRETAIGLQLRAQIIGKVRLALTPWLNHSWHVPFYLTARGWTTLAIPCGTRILQIDFDLIDDQVLFATSEGATRSIALAAGTIADFHAQVVTALDALGASSNFDSSPSEMPGYSRFADDHEQRPYDPESVRAFWRTLIQIRRVFYQFRTGFLGKASPIHLFWGSFDLAATRFSGRVAPKHPGGMPGLPDDVACEAYSHEEASVGFWPGSDAFPHAAFYAYAYPEPPGYADAEVQPSHAAWNPEMREFILPYAVVRAASDPDAALMAFCQSTYDAAADLATWDRASLECPIGHPRTPRQV